MALVSHSFADFPQTGSTIVIPVPTGSASGQYAVVAAYVTNNVTPSTPVPTGFTANSQPTYISGTIKGGLVWWVKKLTGSESGSWTFTTSASHGGATAYAVLVDGRDQSGTPFDFKTQNSAAPAGLAAAPPAVTGTATAGADVLYFLFSWDEEAGLSATPFTSIEQDSGGQHLFAAENVTAGSITPTVTGMQSASDAWWPAMISIKKASGGGSSSDGTLTGALATTASAAVAGTFSPSGGGGDIPGVLAAYSFDSGSAVDDSGNGNDGTLIGTNIDFAAGHTGIGARSDGVATGSYISVADGDGVRPATAVTLACWANLESGQTIPSIFIAGKTRTSGDESYSFYASPSGNPLFGIVSGGSVSTYAIGTAGTICDDTYHHLAGSYDGTNVKFYRDGVLETTTAGSGALVYDTSPFCMGGSSSHLSDRMVGTLDDVRIFDTALTADEITSVMNTPVGASTANGTLHGVAATAASGAVAGTFESSSFVTGSIPTTVSTAIPGTFSVAKDATMTGQVATTSSAAVAGEFGAAVNGVMVGAITSAFSAAIPGTFASTVSGILAGALATTASAATAGQFTVSTSFAGLAATATSRAIAGTLAGHLAHTALIVSAVTGPGISAIPTGAAVVAAPVTTGAGLSATPDGPNTSIAVTGAAT